MHKARAVVYTFMAIGNVLISIFFIRLAGEIGAALGTCITLIAGNIIFMNWYYHTRIGLNIFSFWKNIAQFTPALLISAVAGIVLNYALRIESIPVLIVCICIYTCVYCIAVYFFGMNHDEKQLVSEMLHKFSKK